jgi:hypothetical protein
MPALGGSISIHFIVLPPGRCYALGALAKFAILRITFSLVACTSRGKQAPITINAPYI